MEIRHLKAARNAALASVFLGLFLSTAGFTAVAQDLTLALPGYPADTKNWSADDLARFKQTASQERDPVTGKMIKARGVLLSALVEKTLEKLPPERKAQVDLIVLKTTSGNQVLVPRSVITKYPLLLATQDHSFSVIVPWTSKPKIMSEGLPLETFFVSNLGTIELASYREKFGSVFLKRRTDPLAMRGEKVFVQQCMTCHSEGTHGAPFASRTVASTDHPKVKGVPKLNDRDQRALGNYFTAFRIENGLSNTAAKSFR